MDALRDAKNDRLWFKTNTKLGKLYLDREEWPRLARILRQLHLSCQNVDGSDDLRKGLHLNLIKFVEILSYGMVRIIVDGFGI